MMRRSRCLQPVDRCLDGRWALLSVLLMLVMLQHDLDAPLGICYAFIPRKTGSSSSSASRERIQTLGLHGWLEDFFEPRTKAGSSKMTSRQARYPEQYPATYELNTDVISGDERLPEAMLVRPLLKNTQLQSRPLQLVYSCTDKNAGAWNPRTFHSAVDGKGAAIVIATARDGKIVGGYNPKGWASLGGARPSVAAFLFYERKSEGGRRLFQKLQKVGGGGLACARDDPGFGISFGADGLVISLQPSRERLAQSKLGPYFERGPEDRSSLFDDGGAKQLRELKILVGRYELGEEIPYSGGVLDMTSG